MRWLASWWEVGCSVTAVKTSRVYSSLLAACAMATVLTIASPGTATVSVCYMGVNGRDGSVFDSSFQRGAPVDFPLTGVIAGFQKAITGQKVGSTVAVAVTSADGYPSGQPSAGIRPGDSLIFAIKILDATG